MKVRFFLRSNKVERSEIMLVVRYGTAGQSLKELRIHTGLTAKPKQWNKVATGNNRKDRQRLNTIAAREVNEKLDRIEIKVNDFIKEARSRGCDPLVHIKENIYTANVLESKYATSQAELEQQLKAKQYSVLYYYELFVADREKKIGKEFTEGTVRGIKSKLESFKSFLGSKAQKLKFEDITEDWFEGWKDYLFYTANLTNNTVEKHIKLLKTVLAWCNEKGYYQAHKYKQVLKTKGLATEADTVALTQQEVIALENLDLSNNKRLEEVRDLFLLEIYTSLRISDLQDFKPEHIVNGNTLQKRSKKTSTLLHFFIRPKCKAIIEKYGGVLPTYKVRQGKGTIISEQKANEYIKEICAMIGLDTIMVERTRRQGTAIKKEVIPKSEAISNHTGRRTFTTISLDAGYTERDVRRVTGHKDTKTLLKYDRPTLREQDRDALRAWWSERGSV